MSKELEKELLANFKVFATVVNSPRCPICDGDGYIYELEESIIDNEYGTRIETRIGKVECTNCQMNSENPARA